MNMDVRGRRVTIMGLGLFGGGVAAARYMVQAGARVTVTDLRDAEALAESIAQLQGLPIAFHLGGHREADFREADLVVVNPAVPRNSPFLDIARQAGVPLTSEINLFWDRLRGRCVGVTGTNGKSTTTAMIHAILSRMPGRAWLGGNIGHSLLEEVDQIGPEDWAVLELSSFQLEDLGAAGRSPQVGVVTNFGPSHEKHHGSWEAYRRAKQQILLHQRPADAMVLNADDPEVRSWAALARGRVLWFGLSDRPAPGAFLDGAEAVLRLDGSVRRLALDSWLQVPGRHNRANALAAMAAAAAVGASTAHMEQGLRGFRGLPDRLELVAQWRGVRYYNDSIATTPESVMVALEAFAEPIVLIAGGYDKGADNTELARRIARRVRAAILIGRTGPALAALIRQHLPHAGHAQVHEAASLEAAVRLAATLAQPGDVVLLSPATASYDMFRNYRHRGQCFAEAVRACQRSAGSETADQSGEERHESNPYGGTLSG